jgi:hypothetical protein
VSFVPATAVRAGATAIKITNAAFTESTRPQNTRLSGMWSALPPQRGQTLSGAVRCPAPGARAFPFELR